MKKKLIQIRLKRSNVFLSTFRFGLTLLYTFFGGFLKTKKFIFLHHNFIFCTFFEKEHFFRHSILIFCHFVQFSFSLLFLSVFRYTLVAISGTIALTPIDVRFFGFYFVLIFKALKSQST